MHDFLNERTVNVFKQILTLSLIILLMQHKLNIFHLHNLKGLEFKVEDSNEEDTSPTQVEPLPLLEEGVGRTCPGLQLVKRVTYREHKVNED